MKNKIHLLRLLSILVFFLSVVNTCYGENVKKSIDDNRDDNGEPENESLDIPVENESNLTCTRRQNSQIHEIRRASYKQFPFMAAVMSQQDEYLCSGAVVSNGLILTTAKCTLHPVSYVLLNATRDKKDENTIMLHVIKSEKFPTFTGGESLKNIGLIYTETHNNTVCSKIRLSDFTNTRNMLDLEAVGYGLNAEVGAPKELQYIGMELRSPLEGGEILKAYFDCVDTKVPTCFRDTGSAAIYDNELIGIVAQGQDECTKEMTATYAINKKMADIVPTFTFKAWLDERIKKNEETWTDDSLAVYPNKPVKSSRRKLAESVGKTKANKVNQLDKNGSQKITIWYPILVLLCFVTF